MFGITEWLCALAVICFGIWYYLVANYNYWKQLGVPGPEPVIMYGNLKNKTSAKRSMKVLCEDVCRNFQDAPMVGIYLFRSPMLLLRDPELIKDVMIKDFSTFSERGFRLHEKLEPLNSGLFNLETKRWRALRPKLSPAFTSGKMKHMFTLIVECAENFEKYVDVLVEKNEIVDCRDIAGKFTTDVIGSCAFGLHMNSLADGDSEFRNMGKKMLECLTKESLVHGLRHLAPWLYERVGISIMRPDLTEFFMSSVKQTMEHRKKTNVHRGDLIDLLMDIKHGPQTPDLELTDSLLTAQAFVFFVAGFETSATTISHALLELAQQQDVQERLRREIIDSLKKANGSFSYESVKEMKYLDMVFKETLRLRPPLPIHFRQAVTDYTFRNTNVTIRKGQIIWIPISELHENPKYYPNPELFDPERFTEDMIKSRHPMTYLPFGDGPRNCIGARFAIYQTKLSLIKILAKYKIDLSDKVQLPYKPEPTSFLLQPVGGVHLKFSKIDKPE